MPDTTYVYGARDQPWVEGAIPSGGEVRPGGQDYPNWPWTVRYARQLTENEQKWFELTLLAKMIPGVLTEEEGRLRTDAHPAPAGPACIVVGNHADIECADMKAAAGVILSLLLEW